MEGKRVEGIRACVFDAYGTLFDVNSATAPCLRELGDKADALNRLWREKQLQYTWLRACQGKHADFWQVTADALDFAVRSLGIGDDELRRRLMQSYLALGAYPEVPNTLARLKGLGFKLAILSNGTPDMLQSAVENAKLDSMLDAVFSVEQSGIYKPHPSVYRLAVDGLGIARRSDLLRFIQRMGRLRRFGLWHARHLVQSRRSAGGKFAGKSGDRAALTGRNAVLGGTVIFSRTVR